jgi:polyisoprenoid-binding protein YceI
MSQWKAIPDKSYVGFFLKHLMFSKVTGRFSKFSSTLTLSDSHFEESSVEAKMETASVSTNDQMRDSYIVGDDFFQTNKFSFISFTSKRIQGDFSHFNLHGLLTIKDQSKMVSLECQLTWQNPEHSLLKVEASGKVNRKDFGLSWNALLETGGILVGENVNLEILVFYELVK